MYLRIVTLVFSLALGPGVKLLNAQEAAAELTSVPNYQSTVVSQVTDLSPGEKNTEPEETATAGEDPTTESLTTEGDNVAQTSEENRTMSELLTTPEPAAIPASTIRATYELSTLAAPPEATSQPKQEEETTMTTLITSTEPNETPSPSPTVPDPPTLIKETPVSTLKPTSYEETTDTSPTPTPTTTPTPMPTPTIIITSTQEHTMLNTPVNDTSMHPEKMTPTTNSGTAVIGAGSSIDTEESKKGANWLIIGVIALVIFCILMTLCVMAIIIKRRKQSGKQDFGYVPGQRSKKKLTENDVWAGPVTLGGGDGEGPDEGNAQGEEKKADEVEVTGLSTFVTLEENGGVGRPGSAEVEKWEEKEPLLFIDEEGKEKGKEAGKSAKEGAGKTDATEAEPNGGETFCLTTAV